MLLNGAALNGAALNGGTLGITLTQGAADFDTPSAELTAQATRIHAAAASASCTGEVVANGARGVQPAAVIQGVGELLPTGRLALSGGGSFDGSAGFVAFVVRLIEAQAAFTGQALFDAIAQGAFGASDIDAEATISATGTKILGGAAANASCTGDLAADALATRQVEAIATLGTAEFTAAYEVDDGATVTHYTGATLGGTGELELVSDFIFYNSSAVFNGAVTVAPSATQEQFAGALFSTTAELIGSLANVVYGEAAFAAEASVTADPIRGAIPTAAFVANAEISARIMQDHKAALNIEAMADVVAAPTIVGALAASVDASGQLVADAVRVAPAEATVAGECEIVANPVNLEKVQAESAVAANADVYAEALVFVIGNATLGCTGILVGEARTNVEADDPPERTMARPFSDRTMRRPYVDREMRLAA